MHGTDLLINNYISTNKILGRQFGGLTNPLIYIRPEVMRNYYTPESINPNAEQIKRDSFPTGTNPPYSYVLGDKGALLSATTQINGAGSIVSGLSMGRAIAATLAGTSDITAANLSLITQLAATITSVGTITGANITSTVSLAATLSGTGGITAGMSLLANMIASLSVSGSLVGDLKGKSFLEAVIYVNQSEATVQQLIEGVWNALAASYNSVGTMGEIMNNMGAATDPWTVVLEGAYTAGDMLKILTAVAAGKSTIVDLGGSTATVTFRDINDTADRVVAGMVESERDTVTLTV